MKRTLIIFALLTTSLWLSAACGKEEAPPEPTPFAITPETATTAPTKTPVLSAAEEAVSPTPMPPTQPPAPVTAALDTFADLQQFPPNDPIVIQFTAPVDPDSVTAPLTITPFTLGSFRWDNAYTTIIFTPQNGFDEASNFTIALADGLTAVSNQPITGTRSWELRTAPTPRIVIRRPSKQILSDRTPEITLTFSQPMNKASLIDALTIEPAFAFDLTGDDTTFTLKATESLMPETIYRFTLDETAVSTAQVPIPNALTWTYQIDSMIASITGPTADNRTQDLVITFNYPMDPASVAETLTIDPPTPGKLTWNSKQTIATFTPDAPLGSGTEFQISFDGVLLDADGEPLTLPAPFSFFTPPPILAVYPQYDSIPPNTRVEILFDRPMDQAATNAAFSITPAIDGDFSWDDTMLIFTPAEERFASRTSYTVAIAPSALDAEGDTILNEPYIFTFHTEWLRADATFGDGPNVQVVDVNGRRTLQFTAWDTDNTAKFSFQLFQLTNDQFLEKYSNHFSEGRSHADSMIPSRDATLFREIPYELGVTVNESIQTPAAELLLPDDIPPGFYLVNINTEYVNDQILLILTNYVITLKESEDQLVAWVTDIGGGTAAGVDVAVYDKNGRFLTSSTTDDNGIFRLDSFDENPSLIIAGTETDQTIAGLARAFRTGHSGWWRWWTPTPTAPSYAAYIYTDRPIYKPDQTVFFKAIVRSDDDAIIDILPEGTEVTARLRDARNNIVKTITLTTNSFGTVNGEFKIAAGAMLGDYTIELLLDGESHSQIFKVEDYRKPDYEVSITASSSDVIAGENITFDVGTTYFFGEPVANAKVTARLFAIGEKYWLDEDDDERYVWFERGEVDLDSTRTDENGRISFNIDSQTDYNSQRVYWRSNLEQQLWAVEVTVNDGSNQPVSTFAMVRVYNMAEYMRVDTGGYFHKPGEPFGLTAKVMDVWGNPVNGRFVTLTLSRWNRESRGYDNVRQSTALTTDANGNASLTFTVDEPGFYRLQAVSTDRLGNRIEYNSYVYAFDNRFTSWFSSDTDLKISANQDSYAPGETAQFVIESAFSGPALITFERGTTRREVLVELTAPMTVVDLPIQPEDAPNIHVVINAWELNDTNKILTEYDLWESLPDASLHRASVNLSIPVTNKTLLVTITPDKDEYAPGEEATVTVRITNPAGTPVSAEVSLAVVDEAIFSLSNDLSGPMFDAFYFERANLVRTYDSMSPVRLLVGGLGGGGGGGDLAGNPRSNFQDTAKWFPVLHTDFNGEATVTFTLPDNLTSWRLTAKATTADTQVGESHTNLIVNKKVLIRPLLPRILTANDTLTLSALIQNFSNETLSLNASLTIDNSQLTIDNSPPPLTLPPGQSQIIGWPITVESAGTATIHMQISTNDTILDAIQLPLTIQPLAIPDITTIASEFQGQLDIPFELPPDALPMSTLRIDLSRSIAGSLTEGLEYLTGFPYGCVEQTMSRALPNAVVGRAFFQLGIGSPTIQADLPPKINASIPRLYGFQHEAGGWGWWLDDPSH
ncbi:MAG: hypothetical protein DWQ04_07490, partial [Chloroflexi bacterium]